MRALEQLVKLLFNKVGLDVVKTRPAAPPSLPVPSAENVRRAAEYFADSFAIAPESGLSHAEIEAAIRRYLWFFPFEFGGIKVDFDAERAQAPHYKLQSHRERHAHIFPALLSLTGGSLRGCTVLDIACNAGFWSIQAKRAGADRVLGVDASAENIEQAEFVKQVIGMDGVHYQLMNAYDISKETVGEFDVCFFFGLLYHLDKPIMAFERVHEVTRKYAVIDTRLVNLNIPMLRVEPDSAPSYHRQSYTNPLAMIPSAGAVPLMLKSVGFREVYQVPNRTRNLPTPYLTGHWATFIAVK